MSKVKSLEIRILSKMYQVTCPEGAEEQLLEAVTYLDQKLRDIKNQGKVISIERIAIMAALNITHELLSYQKQKEIYVQSVSEQIQRLQNKIDEALMGEQTSDED